VGNLIVKELHDKARGTQRTSLLQSAPASSHARAAPKPKLLLSDVRDGAVCGSAIAVGDVLVEIDGESVRGKDPGTMSVRCVSIRPRPRSRCPARAHDPSARSPPAAHFPGPSGWASPRPLTSGVFSEYEIREHVARCGLSLLSLH
jgi:hypothetical protein